MMEQKIPQTNEQPPDAILDAKGLLCPLPVIKTIESLRGKPKGYLLEVLATDPGVLEDFPLWCKSTGNAFRNYDVKDNIYHCWIEKTGEHPK